MNKIFNKINGVNGEIILVGDKSISHRAVIFSSMSSGTSSIKNLSQGEDVKSTIKIMQQLGTKFTVEDEFMVVEGCGFKGFKTSGSDFDCGNSGTSARLIAGLLAAQNFKSTLIGDESLSKRPMKRVIEPLTRMGAQFNATKNLTLPLTIDPKPEIIPINYEMPLASAQVKSSVILAGLHCESETKIIESVHTRNHTEKMLGLPVQFEDGKIISTASKKYYPEPSEYFVPGDISTSAFHIVLTLLTPNSGLLIKNVSLNPTRTGFIEVLKQMGANISFEDIRKSSNEEFGNVLVKSSSLKNITINSQIIPNIIDEIPVLTIAGIFAEGDFLIENVKELRLKESDRISSICLNLKQLGLIVDERLNGFSVGGSIKYSRPIFESYNDHRMAMSFAVLCMLMEHGGEVNGFECVKISNPQFEEQIKSIVN